MHRFVRRLAVVVAAPILSSGSLVALVAPPAAASAPAAPVNGRFVLWTDGGLLSYAPDGSSRVMIDAAGVLPSVSADGKRVAYTRLLAQNELWIADVDGKHKQHVLTRGTVIDSTALSPDGSRVAFSNNDPLTSCEAVYVLDLTTHAVTKASPDVPWPIGGAYDCRLFMGGLGWSPDGRTLAYGINSALHSYQDLGHVLDIATLDLATGQESFVTMGLGTRDDQYWYPRWSPDGAFLTYEHRTQEGAGQDVRVVAADGSTDVGVAAVADTPEWVPTWSPDGTTIAFATQPTEVWGVDAGGGNRRLLFHTAEGIYEMHWAPVPPPVVRPTLAETQGRVSLSDVNGQIIDVDPDGTLHPLGILGQQQTWSPDGSKLAYVDLTSTEIRVADADGSNDHVLVAADPALLEIGRGYLNFPTWSPDGSRIGYAAWSEVCGPAHAIDRGWAIYAVDADGSNVEKLSPPVIHWLASFPICRDIYQGVSWGPGGQIAFATSDTQEFWSRSVSTFKLPKDDIVLVDVNTRTERNLTWDDVDDRHTNVWPTWTGDGRVAYAASDFFGLPVEYAKPDLRMRNVDGSGEVNLTTTPEEYELLSAWSPSGSHVAFIATSAEDPDAQNLYLMRADGTGVHTHARVDQGFRNLTWHPVASASPDVTITDCTDTAALAAITTVTGNLIIDVGGSCPTLTLLNLTTVGGDVLLSGDATLTELVFPALTSVAGDVDVSCNATLTSFDVPVLEQVTGDVDVSQNASLTDLSAPTLTTIGGDVDVSQNASFTGLSAPTLTAIGGDLDVTANATLADVTAPTLTTIGGDFDVSGNATMTSISFPTVTTIGGDVDVSADVTFTPLDCTTGEPGSPATVTGQDLDLVSIPTLTAIGGDVDVSAGDGGVDLATGDTTTVTLLGGTATMQLDLPAGSFEQSTGFGVTAIAPSGLVAVDGTLAGGPVSVDPVTGYAFTFDVPTLDADATLAFSLDLASLDDALAAALQAALDAGTLTLWTKNDAGATQAFPICISGATPTAGGCVRVTVDGDHVHFEGVVGHFSSYGVGVVTVPVVDPPPVAHAGGPYSVVEGASLSLDASASSADSTAFAWDLDSDGQYDDATGATPLVTPAQLAVLRDGPAVATVSVRVTDGAGQAGTAQTGLSVTNAVPTATVAPATGAAAVGAPYAITLSATDPSSTDTTTGFVYAVAWGDGSSSATGSHTYSAPGTYAISVTATDKDSGTSAPVTAGVVVAAPVAATAALVPDVCLPALTSVVVRGTSGADVVSIAPVKSLVGVTVNGRLLGTFAPSGRIAVYAGDGNDTVTIDPKLSRDVVILGGQGNDAITSDQGTGIYVGGPGNDTITAGKSRDLVLGGLGTDTLRAGQGDDLLVAGATSYDDDLGSLCATADRWSRTDLAYSARLDLVRALVGPVLGASDDAARDDLQGGQGQDWFVARPGAVPPGDLIDRTAATEVLTQLT